VTSSWFLIHTELQCTVNHKLNVLELLSVLSLMKITESWKKQLPLNFFHATTKVLLAAKPLKATITSNNCVVLVVNCVVLDVNSVVLVVNCVVLLLILLFCVLLIVLFCVQFVCKRQHNCSQHNVSYHTSHSTPLFPLYHIQCRVQIITLF